MKRITFLLLLIFTLTSQHIFSNIKAPTEAKDIQISILTCGPGDLIYTLFGHTAIRVNIPSQHFDYVYNYGLFNFGSGSSTLQFVLKFALGETDYQMGQSPYSYFLYEYKYFKRDVWEQVLNISLGQKREIIEALETNLLPENITYRYNFFYDNCATRPLNKVEDVIGKFNINKKTPYTYRDIVNKYTKDAPWSRFGMNFCLGSLADKNISTEQLAFAPIELMQILDQATINGEKLTSPIKTIFSFNKKKIKSTSLATPNLLFTALFIIITLLSFYQVKKFKNLYLIDTILFTVAGVAGSIITFLVLFSEHPTVSPNYIVFIFHPLHILGAVSMSTKARKKRITYYHLANLTILTFFTLFYPWIPQEIDFAVLPLAGCLYIRSLTYLLYTRKSA